MRLHTRARIRRNVPWMEIKIKEKGRNPNPKKNLVKGARRMTCPKLSVFTIMK